MRNVYFIIAPEDEYVYLLKTPAHLSAIFPTNIVTGWFVVPQVTKLLEEIKGPRYYVGVF